MIAGLTQIFKYEKKEDALCAFSNIDGSIKNHPVALASGETELWINDLRIGEIEQTIFVKLEACKIIE